jgi:hypothetical protein
MIPLQLLDRLLVSGVLALREYWLQYVHQVRVDFRLVLPDTLIVIVALIIVATSAVGSKQSLLIGCGDNWGLLEI